MRPISISLVVCAALALGGGVLFLGGGDGVLVRAAEHAHLANADHGHAPAADHPETARIHAHLIAVEAELRGADVSHLSAAQRAARSRVLDELARYRQARVYPHNHDVAARTPYFIDEHGTRCAMAHLIESSGHGALVARVATTRNNAYVPELADDPALGAWLDEYGLSVADAARIQPAYDGCGWSPGDCSDVSAEYGLATAASSALSGAAIALNVPSDASDGRGLFALASGGVGLVLGAPKLDDANRTTRVLGMANVALGGAAVILGLRTLLTDSSPPPPAPTGGRAPGWSVEPTLGPSAAALTLRGAF